MKRSFFTLAFLLACTGCVRPQPQIDPSMPYITALERAQYQRQIGNIDEAIKHYRAYISERLKKVNRLQEEDPNYYLIVIGDLLFDSRRVEEAYQVYEEAELKGVAKNFVVDRYIKVAHWYQAQKNFVLSECVLNKHSFLDPLVFQGEMDQAARKRTVAEDLGRKAGAVSHPLKAPIGDVCSQLTTRRPDLRLP